MTAGRYCNRDVVITAAESSVVDTAKLMRDYHVGDVVIVERREGKNYPLGIITDRDLVVEVLAQDVPHESVAIRDIMSAKLVQVYESDDLLETLQKMRAHGVRRVPVVSTDGVLQGILTADDVINMQAEISGDLSRMLQTEVSREIKKTGSH